MVFPGREQFRAAFLRYVEVPGARALSSVGLTPNAVTLLGFSISLTAAVLVGAGFLLAGGCVFLAGGALDLMDGALARLTSRVTKFGALLDSVTDRLGEAALLVGVAVHVLRAELSDDRQLFAIVVVLLALVGSQMVSYVRARGEGLGVSTRTGLATRPERVVLMSLGLVLGLRALEVLLIVIAAASAITIIQRLLQLRQGLDQKPPA